MNNIVEIEVLIKVLDVASRTNAHALVKSTITLLEVLIKDLK